MNTYKILTDVEVLVLLTQEGKCPADVNQQQVKYLNNTIECNDKRDKKHTSAVQRASRD